MQAMRITLRLHHKDTKETKTQRAIEIDGIGTKIL